MNKIILFGAGNYGEEALRFYGSDKVECFADNNPAKIGIDFCEKKVIDFEELKKIASEYYIIISVYGDAAVQISSQLADSGIFNFDFWSPSMKSVNFNVESAGARIYSRLCDDISRVIFEYRTMRFITDDLHFIAKMIRTVYPAFDKQICEWDNCKLILCNPTSAENLFAMVHKNIVFALANTGITDKQEVLQGALKGLNTYPFECVNDFEHSIFILPFYDENNRKVVFDELTKLNVPNERIFDLAHFIRKNDMYFDLPHLQITENEIFIDAGCYNGYTTKTFLKLASSGKVFAFEPELKQFEVCKKELAGIPNVSLINAGLWNKKGMLSFRPLQNGASRISATGEDCINVISLDECLEDERVTFIKMDVEGAEVNALKGAQKIIRSQKPKLAISVYHNPEDILTIPETILKINPGYKFYLRHYTLWNSETVLYAI